MRIEKGVALYAAVNPKANLIYLSYPISNFILVVDLISRSFRQQLHVDSPGNIAINSVTNRIYVSSADGIYDMDGFTGEFHVVKKRLSLHTGSVDINPVTNTLYTTSFKSDVVSVINAETYSEIDEISVGKNPQGIAVNSNANTAYVANSDSESISVIDTQSNKVIDTIRLNGFSYSKLSMKPTFLLLNDLSNLLYVQATKIIGGYIEHAPITLESNALLVIDLATKKKIRELKLETVSRQGFAYNQSNNSVYTKIFHEDQKSIARYDADAGKLLDIVKLEPGIWKGTFGDSFFNEAVAVNSIANKVYVSDSDKSVLYEVGI